MTPNVSRTRAWITASRPKTLPAAVGPVIVGTAAAVAAGGFHLPAALAALAGAILIQIAVNIANDYFDHLHGYDTAERTGPTRVAASGLLPMRSIRRGLILVLALVVAIASYAVYRGGWPIAIAALAAILGTLAYSAGPLPLASNALGEPFAFFFFGPVAVCGTYYVQTLELNWTVFALSVPIGLLVAAILVVNNYRDIGTDRSAGKNTLATRLGPGKTRVEYVLLLLGAYLMPVLLALRSGSWWLLLPLASILFAIPPLRDMFTTESGPELNRTLAATAGLSLVYGILLAAGVVLAG